MYTTRRRQRQARQRERIESMMNRLVDFVQTVDHVEGMKRLPFTLVLSLEDDELLCEELNLKICISKSDRRDTDLEYDDTPTDDALNRFHDILSCIRNEAYRIFGDGVTVTYNKRLPNFHDRYRFSVRIEYHEPLK